MKIEITEEPISALARHGEVPIAFEVRTVFEVSETAAGKFQLTDRPVAVPWVKNYDAIAGERPAQWAERFDGSSWGLLGAWRAGERVGGAVIAHGGTGVDLLEGRTDLAVLWDIRVAAGYRNRGVGTDLFHAAERWAAARGCRELKVETQNINVPACRFYARQGCELRAVRRGAYPAFPDEVQLFWSKVLG